MPTLFSHPAVPLAIGFGLGRRIISPSLLAVGVALAVLPDLDVLMLRLGIPYENGLSHRGFSHSMTFAFLFALLGAKFSNRFNTDFRTAFVFLFLSTISHGLLDCLTNGGYGIALLWPFSDHRFFAPFQPIEVSPLGLQRFFSMRGIEVILSEIMWVWLPAVLGGIALRIGQNRFFRL
jgi:inner membrane protein